MGSTNQPPQQKASNFGSLLGLGTWWFCLVFGILSYGCSLICVLFWVLGFEKGGIFCLGCGGWTVLGGWTALSCLEEEWVMEMEMKMVKEGGFHSSGCGFLSSFGEGFKWESTWQEFIGWRKTSVLRHSLIERFLLNQTSCVHNRHVHKQHTYEPMSSEQIPTTQIHSL